MDSTIGFPALLPDPEEAGVEESLDELVQPAQSPKTIEQTSTAINNLFIFFFLP